MTNRFLISVAAAAVIAGAGFANAQIREGGAGGSSAQQSGPSSDRGGGSSATQQREDKSGQSEQKGMKSGQNEQKGQGAAKSQQSEDATKGQKSQQNTATDTDRSKAGKDMKAEGREGAKEDGENAQSKQGMSKEGTKEGTTAQGREGRDSNMNAQTKGGMDKSQSTTGNATTSASAPPAEKRTQIVSAIKQERIEETTNVNFNISVGATVPANVRFHPISERIVEIYPEWRGFEVILVKGRYVIVRPQTHEIVYIVEG